MTIKKIELLNFQVIKEFNAEFNGDVYLITGDNELGKSTLLKAIGALLTGERDAVLRNGEEKGFAKMVIGGDGKEYEVKLSFTKKNPRGMLSITSKDGLRTSNVSALQQIFGYTDFDAVEFSRWSETAEGRRKQILVVKSLLPEPIRKRIEEIDEDVMNIKEERKNFNKSIATYEAICNKTELPTNWKDYTKRMDIATLMEEQAKNAQLIEKAKTIRQALKQRTEQLAMIPSRIEAVNEYHDNECLRIIELRDKARTEYEMAIQIAKQNYDATLEELSCKQTQIDNELASTLDTIEEERKDYEMRKSNAEKWLKNYEESKVEESNTAELLRKAEEHNMICANVEAYEKTRKQLDELDAEIDKCETSLSKLAEERAMLVEQSRLPIEGLTFTEDGLELNGIPFVAGKVSDSQIMEVATKLIIASNPKVKVFRIARGESLGAKRLQSIVDIAKANGFQGFIEEVKRGQEDLIVEEYTEN